MTLSHFTLACYALAGIVQLVFVIGYHRFTRGAWLRSLIGIQLMSMAGIIASVLALSIARRVFGDYPGRVIAAAALSAGFLAVSCVQLVALIREQRRPIDVTKED